MHFTSCHKIKINQYLTNKKDNSFYKWSSRISGKVTALDKRIFKKDIKLTLTNEYVLEYVIKKDYGMSWLFKPKRNKIVALELSTFRIQLNCIKHYVIILYSYLISFIISYSISIENKTWHLQDDAFPSPRFPSNCIGWSHLKPMWTSARKQAL